MPAAYDSYDYPSYWKGRSYEHSSEFLAIKSFLSKISKVDRSIEIGAGFGRLFPSYGFRVKKALLTDPSARLISIASKKYPKTKKIDFLQSKLENLQTKKGLGKFDLAIMVRVLHHIEDIDSAFEIINSLLEKGGYFILEFPNKSHAKANLRHFLKGDFTYPIDIFPVDLRSRKSLKNNALPFINYHPDQVYDKLKQSGFEILEIRSVSNIRSSFLKRIIPLHTLIDVEKLLQVPFSKLNFGPSLFVLARKRS